MGVHHGGNGDNLPPDGDRPRDSSQDPATPGPPLPGPALPELPAGIQIPDDLSELAEEAEQIRRELAREREQGRSGSAQPGPDGSEPSIGVPLLIMSVAVIITLVSLFAMTWSGSSTITPDDASTERPSQLPAVVLTDSGDAQVALADHLPVAILLVEECDCDALLASTVATAPAGVTVVGIDQQAPARPAALAPDDPAPLLLSDPTGGVRAQLDLDPPTNAATVVLVNRDGQITSIHDAATSVAQFQTELTSLVTP